MTNKGQNIALIGLGPHSKRTYMSVLEKNGMQPKLIVDLKGNEENVRAYLKEQNLNAELFFIPDENKDDEVLDSKVAKGLLAKIKELDITHSIISTEPKSHFGYMRFFIENGVNTLVDKPITVTDDMYNPESIKKIKDQYDELLELCKKHNGEISVRVMTQRRFHKGYMYIMVLLKDVIEKYNIPMTYISMFHSDGKWMMPHDYDTENHPYKYGYGKLFHSGYHFVDMLSEFIKLNNNLSADKKITNMTVYSVKYDLVDDATIISKNDLLNLFEGQEIPEFYKQNEINPEEYTDYGEKDFHAVMQFKTKEGRTITIANLDMLQNSFSRRAWFMTKDDVYKGNGRIRHESVNIEVGPLLNVQIHSYQSKEAKDREDMETERKTGGLDHFDILIFRNSDLIGGEPFEEIHLDELYEDVDEGDFQGYNELSREEFVMDFLNGNSTKSNLEEHKLAVELLYNIALSMNNEEGGEKSSNIEKLL